MVAVTTDRLILRRWRESDRKPFAGLNADPRVMESSRVFCRGMKVTRWSIESKTNFEVTVSDCAPRNSTGSFLNWFYRPRCSLVQAPFTPCVEIGWRLSADHWGLGFATERGAPRSPAMHSKIWARGAGLFYGSRKQGPAV